MSALDYQAFLERKAHLGTMDGFTPSALPDFLFDFQRALVEYAVRRGRAAVFADCGLGKTGMELAWGEQVVRHTNKHVLLLTPLAVAEQTVREAEKFGIDCYRSPDGRLPSSATIVVTNYDRLHQFNPDDFAGVACDESSILKNFDGSTRLAVTEFLKKRPYRSLWTATAAPNDYHELGTSSEALGALGYMDMLNRFFRNDLNNSATGRAYGNVLKWRFKGHAEEPFWRWVTSWARALRKPSDLGFDDARFILPPLEEVEHVVAARSLRPGELVGGEIALGLKQQRDELRRTIPERCDTAASLVADTGQPALVWCHFNEEGDRLEQMIPDAVQVGGKDADEAKEEKFRAFIAGEIRVLVTKPKIGAWGLNFQHCAHVVDFPSHSFEQYYQGVRRCWRFGQTRPVRVDTITPEGGRGIVANRQRKSAQADRMFARLIEHMTAAVAIDRQRTYTIPEQRPTWLSSIK